MPAVRIFSRLRDRNWLLRRLRDETVGGFFLLAAAAIALVWANSPWADQFFALVEFRFGPASLGLELELRHWVADGLLAVFFFVVGLELKRELVLGSLSNLREAVVPIVAALGGVVVPALIFIAVNAKPAGEPAAWGTPIATDIAFALAVLAIVGRGLPLALRAFLLTSAVVDDLVAIFVIAVFYNHGLAPLWLLMAIGGVALFALAQHRRWHSPWFYAPLALLIWWLLFKSGVHATIAGVALGFLTRVVPDSGETESPSERMAHRFHPLSAGVIVPLFAFTAAGVRVDPDVARLLTSPLAVGIMVALVLGKPIGIVATAWIATKFTRAELPAEIRWLDIVGVGILAGIGFTVSLLIASLSLTGDQLSVAKLAVLIASATSAVIASGLLLWRGRWHRHHADSV